MKKILFLFLLLLVSCTSEESPLKKVGKDCVSYTECETPGEYLIRSVCPFVGACVGGRCKVVCYEVEDDVTLNESKLVQCTQNKECRCQYLAEDEIRCGCLAGYCGTVVKE